MSNFGVLRETILGCVSRKLESFQAGSQNFADLAINNALIYTQRQWDFNFLKEMVTIECNPKGSMLRAKDNCGQPIKLKRIIKAMGTAEQNGHTDLELPYISRQTQITTNTDQRAGGCCRVYPVAVIHDGQCVYMTPQPPGTDPHTLYFYAVRWLPRLSVAADTNFLFDYGFDFLMYRSIVELNFFIKEDERFGISQRMLDDAWKSLVAWDITLISPTETEID